MCVRVKDREVRCRTCRIALKKKKLRTHFLLVFAFKKKDANECHDGVVVSFFPQLPHRKRARWWKSSSSALPSRNPLHAVQGSLLHTHTPPPLFLSLLTSRAAIAASCSHPPPPSSFLHTFVTTTPRMYRSLTTERKRASL
jgi:hypothetical protein